jgi:hypothetical protein
MDLLEVWVGRAHERLRKTAHRLRHPSPKGATEKWLGNLALECSDAADSCEAALKGSVRLTNWKAIALGHAATIERLQAQLDKFYKPNG